MSIPNYPGENGTDLPSYDTSQQSSFPTSDPKLAGRKNTVATVALVIAIIGLLLSWFPIFGALIPILAFAISVIAMFQAKKYSPEGSNKGKAITAFGLSILSIIICIGSTILVLQYIADKAGNCLSIADPTAMQQCIQEELTK